MTAFLFIPAATGAAVTRRVDLTNFASLFAEVEEPAALRARGPLAVRILAMLLVLVLAIGDTILVTRPDTLAHAGSGPSAAAVVPVTSL